MLNIRNEIWRWSLTKENMRYLVWAKPEFIYMLVCYHCFTHSVLLIFPKCKLNAAKSPPWKWYRIGLSRLKGGFSGLRHLFNSQIILLQIPIALYLRRRNGFIWEEQYQIKIQQNPTSFLYKYWAARKVDKKATFIIGLPTKTTFDGCMSKYGHDRFMSRILLYQRC